MLAAAQLGADINKKAAWTSVLVNVGGLKLFCLGHADKFKWVSEGSGQVQLVRF